MMTELSHCQANHIFYGMQFNMKDALGPTENILRVNQMKTLCFYRDIFMACINSALRTCYIIIFRKYNKYGLIYCALYDDPETLRVFQDLQHIIWRKCH